MGSFLYKLLNIDSATLELTPSTFWKQIDGIIGSDFFVHVFYAFERPNSFKIVNV